LKLKELLKWREHIGKRVQIVHRTIDAFHYNYYEGTLEEITDDGRLRLRFHEPRSEVIQMTQSTTTKLYDSGTRVFSFTHIRSIKILEE